MQRPTFHILLFLVPKFSIYPPISWKNFTRDVSDQLNYGHPNISVKGVDYCNVTVTYTHPGQNDTLNVETWLPMKDWNHRLQAVGGGGWVSGRFPLSYTAMAGAIGEGYVTSSTDGGLVQGYTPDPWALNSPGNVNLYALQNFASVALNDQVCCNHITSQLWVSYD